jgi:hypothetical protein
MIKLDHDKRNRGVSRVQGLKTKLKFNGRQDALVAQLEAVHRRRLEGFLGGWFGGTRSRLKNRYIDEMVAEGYSRSEAAESAQRCDDIAYRRVDHAALLKQMGGVA